MSEIRRVALNTIEPQKDSDNVNKKTCKTVRISVILPESNEDICPEYNYKDQLAAVKRKNKLPKETNHEENELDPFGEDDDDVRRIALEMEAKYGSGVTTAKKKRKGRKDDYADIGMGYDESDSFIDNTDGYDEIIPQNVTTLHGGFYINCGALEFKTDDEASSQISSSSSSESDEEDDVDKRKSVSRKRILETSDDSDSDTAKTNAQAEKKPKMQSDKNSMKHAIKKKLFSQNKIQIKKRRPIDPQKKTVKELLREKREDLDMSVPPTLEKEENLDKDSLKENKKPMSISSVTDAIESVVKQVVEENFDNIQNTQIIDINNPTESAVNKFSSEPPLLTIEGESSQDQPEKRELPKLPENIPTDILEIVSKIKQAALDYRDEGKKKFFSDEVNAYLLSLEKKCKILGKSSRLRIYDFLSYYCKVRKETLIRRAKNLIQEEEERRLKMAMQKLKDCVDYIMPSLIANFELESQNAMAKKFSSDQSEENKNVKLPRRRFQWTEETKKLLKDIMFAKKKCLILEGKQKDNLEELVVTFMRSTVLPIWPEGWMYLNNLKKVFNSMTDSTKNSSNVNKSVIDRPKPEISKDKSNLDRPIMEKPNLDKSTIDKSKLDKSNVDKSNIDRSSVDKTNIEGPLNAIAPKHSNLTITPVEVKSSTTKSDVSNSVTVTKITSDVTSSSTNKISETTTMSGPHLLKKMFDEIVKPIKTDDNKNSSASSVYSTSQEKSKPEKDYSRPKIINLDEPTIKNQSRHSQDTYKHHTEKNLPIEQKSHWQNEIYGSLKEQSTPADYSSKHSSSRHSDEKHDLYKHSASTAAKSLWPNKDTVEPIKYSRPSDGTISSKHSSLKHSSSKSSSSNDNPKPISLSVNDILMKPDKHSDRSEIINTPTKHHSSESTTKYSSEGGVNKHYSDGSRHHTTESTKQYSDNMSKQYSDGGSIKYHSESSTKHRSDNSASKHYSDSNSKNYSDSTKHYNKDCGAKYNSNSATKYHSDSPKHHSDSSKHHSKTSETLKLPADNHVIVLNAHQSNTKDGDSKVATKESNSALPKSMHCQLMDLSDGRGKSSSKKDDNKSSYTSSSKYSSTSSSKEIAKASSKSSTVTTAAATADLLMTTSANYFNDQMKKNHKYSDFSAASGFLSSTPNKMPKNDGDNDIQMVMENLKALQKLSGSPVKNDSTSSSVSVIAFNKNFSATKSNSSQGSSVQRSSSSGNDINKSDFSGTNFQDDFQKQFINSIQMSANPTSNTKSNYRCS